MFFLTHPAGSQVEVIYDPQNPGVLELGGGLGSQSSGSTGWGEFSPLSSG